MRLFAGISLPGAVSDHLASALEMVQGNNRVTKNPWVPKVNWHVTLAFYGRQPEDVLDELTESVRLSASQTAPFDLSLGGAGTFRHDVCWIGVSDPADILGGLAQEVRGNYAVNDERARNRFHVTISRSGRKAGLEPAIRALSVYRGPSWTVDEIIIFRSDPGEGIGGHPLYTPLATVPLGHRFSTLPSREGVLTHELINQIREEEGI